LDKYVKNKAD